MLSTSDPSLTGKKFWSDDEWENVEENSDDIQDPRLGAWKIQKRNGFMKDRQDKEKKLKVSKKSKRNSKAPMSDIHMSEVPAVFTPGILKCKQLFLNDP